MAGETLFSIPRSKSILMAIGTPKSGTLTNLCGVQKKAPPPPRKVGDVLFAKSFPEDVRSILNPVTKPLEGYDSEGCYFEGQESGNLIPSYEIPDSDGYAPKKVPYGLSINSETSVPQDMSVNEKTGGRKRSKPLRYDLIPVKPMAEVALLYGLGAKIYEDRNWEKGYDWSLSYAAMRRHSELFWAREDWDADGFHHLAAVAFHAMSLMEFSVTHKELDDRP